MIFLLNGQLDESVRSFLAGQHRVFQNVAQHVAQIHVRDGQLLRQADPQGQGDLILGCHMGVKIQQRVHGGIPAVIHDLIDRHGLHIGVQVVPQGIQIAAVVELRQGADAVAEIMARFFRGLHVMLLGNELPLLRFKKTVALFRADPGQMSGDAVIKQLLHQPPQRQQQQ